MGIDETKDEKLIKEAYLEKVKEVNPEDKPEEFKELRKAYEQAIAYAKSTDGVLKADEFTSQCLSSFDAIYKDMKRRCDLSEWEKLLASDLFTSLQSSQAAQDALIEYINENWRLPRAVFDYLCKELKVEENADRYSELIGEDNVDWLLYDASQTERGLPPQFFSPGLNSDACLEYDMLFLNINSENEE